MTNAVEVNGLTKRYGNFMLDGISFNVPRGFICGFIGQNGAGKTTTLKLMLNMAVRDGGEVKILGRDDVSVRGDIGALFDRPCFQDEWTPKDIEKALRPFCKQWNGTAYWRYIRRFELNPKQKVKTLSRGMKTKLGMAVTLSYNAKLLLLDEPTSGLDPVMRDEMLDILREYMETEGRTVLFSTHITGDLEKIADYIVYIDKGKVLYSGLKDELIEKYCVVRGGKGDLPPGKRVIGLREHVGGFEGMVETADIGGFPPGAVTEAVTLDDIMIYMNRGGDKS